MKGMWKMTSGAVALAIGMFLCGPALADISYNYVELDYVDVDVDFSIIKWLISLGNFGKHPLGIHKYEILSK